MNETTGAVRSGDVDERGEFTFTFIPVGRYTITIESLGFNSYRETGLELRAGQVVRRNFPLRIGEVTEQLTVTSEAPLVNAANAQQDIRFDEQAVKELPIARRDLSNIVTLGAGITLGADASISLNGLPPRGFVLTVDGTYSNADPEIPTIGMYQAFNVVKGLSIEAIKEVQVAKDVFSAETANAIGGNLNLISKNGTNDVHGSLFYNYQSGGMNARHQFLAEKPPLVFNQFGGSVGGPIVENKLFYFGAYEGYRLVAQRAITGNVPSRELRDEAVAAIPASADFWKTWPLPTQDGAPGSNIGFYSGTGPQLQDDDHVVVRVDWNASDNNLLNVRFTKFKPSMLDPRLNLVNSRTFDGGSRNVALNYIRISPQWMSETRVGLNHTDFDRRDNFYTHEVVDLVLSGAFSSGGGRRFAKDGQTYTLENVLAHTRGRHSLKFGGIYQFQRAARIDIGVPSYSFSNRAYLLANQPSSASYRTAKTSNPITTWQLGGFIQDNFRLNSRLMASVGLRYDYYSVMRASNGKVFNRDGYFSTTYRDPDSPYNADYLNFAPRISLAWTLDANGKTVVRTGYGIFTSRHNLFSGPVEIQRDSQTLPAIVRLSSAEIMQLGIVYPDGPAKAVAYADDPNFFGYSVVDLNWRNPYSQQSSFSVQRQLLNDVVVEVGYVGTRGVKLIYGPHYNRIDRFTGLRPFPNFDSSSYYQSGDSTVYHALQASLHKRLSHNLALDMSYAWASGRAYYKGDLALGGGGPQELLVNPQTLAITSSIDQERGPLDFLTRHRFTSNWVYELPLDSVSSGGRGLGLLLRGWQVGGVFVAQTGNPLNISQTSTLPSARPDFVGSSHNAAIINKDLRYLDPKAFALVPLSSVSRATIRPGNLGRNSIFGPGMWSVDLSLSKRLHLKDRLSLQLRVDMFNAFNHTNPSGVVTNLSSAAFGLMNSTRGARELQINTRLQF